MTRPPFHACVTTPALCGYFSCLLAMPAIVFPRWAVAPWAALLAAALLAGVVVLVGAAAWLPARSGARALAAPGAWLSDALLLTLALVLACLALLVVCSDA